MTLPRKPKVIGQLTRGNIVLVAYPNGAFQRFGPFSSRLKASRWRDAFLKEVQPRWAHAVFGPVGKKCDYKEIRREATKTWRWMKQLGLR